jgi:hypothetical protein
LLRTLVIAVLVSVLGTLVAAPAAGKVPPYTTGFTNWRAVDGGFTDWQRDGVALAADGTLSLDPATADPDTDPYPPGSYNGRNYYNGGSFLVGEATSPIIDVSSFTEAIASWNAATPAGTWVETQIRADVGSRWTKWYVLGIWAADTGTAERHSVRAQGDADGFVAVDTLVLGKKATAASFQLKLRLFSENEAVPSVRAASVATSTTPGRPSEPTPGDPALWDNVLAVPECSQMVYPDGGEVWCSPTSTSMVLAYWQNAAGPCEARVRAAVEGVFDCVYDGHGNWPFNTAYAAAQGLEGYVARFTSMAQLEPWIAAGVPVVISYAWKKSELAGAPIPSSNGHLAVVAGFDAAGNPVVNDPAAPSDDTVQRTYLRSELESLWLKTSGGTAYLMFPPGHSVPPL